MQSTSKWSSFIISLDSVGSYNKPNTKYQNFSKIFSLESGILYNCAMGSLQQSYQKKQKKRI